MLHDPAPAVAFAGLGPRCLQFTVLVWANAADYLGMLHNVRCAIYDDLRAANIDVPLSQVVLQQAA